MLVWRRLADLVTAHGAAALVSVHDVKGSAPREAGARMIVRPDGAFHGTIGGGQLEWRMLGNARDALAQGRGPARFVEQALGPDLGQCCGGRVTVLIETFGREDVADLEALAKRESEGAFDVEAVLGEDGRVVRAFNPPPIAGEGGEWSEPGEGQSLQARPLSRSASPTTLSRRGERVLQWRENFGDRLTSLLLFGAGHVGRALALSLAPLPFRIRWIDSRADSFPPHIPANAATVRTFDPEAEIADAAADAFILVMTHEHPLDLAITAAALLRDFPYVGLIGSATKRARFEKRFRELAVPEERIQALHCPIGLRGIAGKEPAVIAASVTAQLLLERERTLKAASTPFAAIQALRSAS